MLYCSVCSMFGLLQSLATIHCVSVRVSLGEPAFRLRLGRENCHWKSRWVPQTALSARPLREATGATRTGYVGAVQEWNESALVGHSMSFKLKTQTELTSQLADTTRYRIFLSATFGYDGSRKRNRPREQKQCYSARMHWDVNGQEEGHSKKKHSAEKYPSISLPASVSVFHLKNE